MLAKKINDINKIIEKGLQILRKLSIKNIIAYFIVTGGLSGFILGCVTSVERLITTSYTLGIVEKVQYLSLSICLMSVTGMMLALIGSGVFIILIFILTVLFKLTKKGDSYHPQYLIASLSIALAALCYFYKFTFLLIIFLLVLCMLVILLNMIDDNYFVKITSEVDNNEKLSILHILIFLISVLSIIYIYIVFLNENILKGFLFCYKNFPLLIAFIAIILLSLLYFSWAYYTIFLFERIYSKEARSVNRVSNNNFSTLNFQYLLKYLYKHKFRLCISFYILIIFIITYTVTQNALPNQLFLNANMTKIIIVLALLTFMILHLLVIINFKYSYIKIITRKKTIYSLIVIYILLLVSGFSAYNSNNALRSFVFRYCTLEKIVLKFDYLFHYNKNLHILPAETTLTKGGKITCSSSFLAASRPNVILITIDGLRNDYFQEFIKDNSTTLSQFSKQAFYFSNDYSLGTWTSSSISTILTSKAMASKADINFKTLAEILQCNGYDTFSTNSLNKETFDTIILKDKKYQSLFAKGFSRQDKFIQEPQAIDSLKEYLNNKNLNTPFFLWIHYYQLHSESYRLSSIFKIGFKATYKTNLRLEDTYIKEFFDLLRQKRLFDKSLIIVTADHGEEFNDHGNYFHCFSLYNELVKVPLLIKLPGQTDSKRITEPVSSLDITPTILNILGYDYSKEGFDGRSLLPLMNNKTLKPLTIYLNIFFFKDFNRVHFDSKGFPDYYHKIFTEFAVVSGNNRWKLIYNSLYDYKELYNIQDDPQEKNNLIEKRPEIAKKMFQKIKKHILQKISPEK